MLFKNAPFMGTTKCSTMNVFKERDWSHFTPVLPPDSIQADANNSTCEEEVIMRADNEGNVSESNFLP